jgi:hypothetical protein
MEEVAPMIMKAEELSQQQRSAVELLLGREVLAAEKISVRAFNSSAPSEADREAAHEKLLQLLNRPRNPQPGLTEEDKDAIFLEAMQSVRPSFRPVK